LLSQSFIAHGDTIFSTELHFTGTFHNGDKIVATVDVDENGNWAVATDKLDNGTLDLHVIVTDVAGHKSDREVFSVNVDTIAPDAPCSSTGTARRHPDILWTKSPNDIAKLAKLQAELLDYAVRLTKVRGTIIFANCSLAAQEGEELIEHFLRHRSDVILSPIDAKELPAAFFSLITGEGFLRSTPADLPHDNPRLAGMDGFFTARLIKTTLS